MRLRDLIRRPLRAPRGHAPTPQIVDPFLGTLIWSSDDEAWRGARDGVRFSVAREDGPTPTDASMRFAAGVLGDLQRLSEQLESQKALAALIYAGIEDELRGLRIGDLHCFVRDGSRVLFVELDGGRCGRCWRMEFADGRCDGIGFDD